MRVTESERTREEGTDSGGAGVTDDGLEPLARERGLPIGVLRAAGIGIADDDRGRDGWWRIPYPHRTGFHKVRYRNPVPGSKPKYADSSGASFHLYNPTLLGAGEAEVWFTEGEFDTLALVALGLPAIGISGVSNVGDPDNEEDSGKFKREWLTLFEDTLCYIIFDNDEAGHKATTSLQKAFLRFDLAVEVFDDWPPGISDLNEWYAADYEGMDRSLGEFRNRVRSSRGLETR